MHALAEAGVGAEEGVVGDDVLELHFVVRETCEGNRVCVRGTLRVEVDEGVGDGEVVAEAGFAEAGVEFLAYEEGGEGGGGAVEEEWIGEVVGGD